MIWYSGDISSNKAEDWIKWWSNEVAGMGTQNAALAGVTPDVCVERRGTNTNTDKSIASESWRVNTLWGQGCLHPCNLGDAGGLPWEALGFLSAPQHGCGLACISHRHFHDGVCWHCPSRLPLQHPSVLGCPLEMLWKQKSVQQLMVGEMGWGA